MAIERLNLSDTVSAATRFAVSQNGADYAVLVGTLLTYIQDNISLPGSLTTQYAAPSATAFSVDVTTGNTWLILTPGAGYADGEIVLPATAADGDEVLVNCTQAVATFVVDGNGNTVTGAPTALLANGYFRLRFDEVASVWYRVG